MKKIVIALGGNALGESPKEQIELMQNVALTISELTEKGYQVILVHGNGPQVGMISNAFQHGLKNDKNIPDMPLCECVSMTQGYSGYHIQQSIQNHLKKLGLKNDVVSLVTQVVVDKNDPAFQNPTKPVGPFYTEEESKELIKKGLTVIEDSGRGYREVVASPLPIDIVEKNVIKTLIASDTIIICGGGGGIPVIDENGSLKGVNAVIDKDNTSALLSKIIDADYFVILTAVNRVCVNFGKPDQIELEHLTIKDAEKYIGEGQFPPGSMLPKIKASIDFVQNNKDKVAIIADLKDIEDAIKGVKGTKIIYE